MDTQQDMARMNTPEFIIAVILAALIVIGGFIILVQDTTPRCGRGDYNTEYCHR